MDIESYNYHLPEQLIAQTPLKDRTSSKFLVLHTDTGEIVHDHFKHVTNYMKSGDCLVLNNSKVITVRLFGMKEETFAKIELLLLHENDNKDGEAVRTPASKVTV